MAQPLKALTIWQPWASLILVGVKTCELRGWNTTYRGTLALHAGAKWDPMFPEKAFAELPRSAIIGTVTLVDVELVRHSIDGQPDEDVYYWSVADPSPLPTPIPCSGRQGLWDLEPALLSSSLALLYASKP